MQQLLDTLEWIDRQALSGLGCSAWRFPDLASQETSPRRLLVMGLSSLLRVGTRPVPICVVADTLQRTLHPPLFRAKRSYCSQQCIALGRARGHNVYRKESLERFSQSKPRHEMRVSICPMVEQALLARRRGFCRCGSCTCQAMPELHE